MFSLNIRMFLKRMSCYMCDDDKLDPSVPSKDDHIFCSWYCLEKYGTRIRKIKEGISYINSQIECLKIDKAQLWRDLNEFRKG